MTEVFYSQWYSKALVAQREERYQDALKALEEGVQNDCGMCCWWLGECYWDGVWIEGPPRIYEAKMWFEKAVSLGCDRARYRCVGWENMSLENVKDSYTKGLALYGLQGWDAALPFMLKSADEENDCFAQCYTGYLYRIGMQTENALKYHTQAAKQGFYSSQYTLGYTLDASQYDEAVFWLRKSAEQGFFNAQFQLAYMYINALGNTAASLYWYNRGMAKVDPSDRFIYASTIHKSIYERVQMCLDSCLTLIAIRKFRGALAFLPKDVVVLLAKYLWKTRDDWSVPPQGVKKLKTKYK